MARHARSRPRQGLLRTPVAQCLARNHPSQPVDMEPQLYAGLAARFAFHNREGPRQSLNRRMPVADEAACRVWEEQRAGTRAAPIGGVAFTDWGGALGRSSRGLHQILHSAVAWCQGGVAGGVPPHKGGPERPDRPTTAASGRWQVVSGQWSGTAGAGYDSGYIRGIGFGTSVLDCAPVVHALGGSGRPAVQYL